MTQQLLLQWGIPTYIYSVETVLQGKLDEKIGDTMEVTVGWVYGLSVNIDGVLPDNSAELINSLQASNFYLTLKYGQSLYINKLRLTHLIYDRKTAGSLDPTNPKKYLDVNIPLDTDLKQSFYSNPSLISGVAIALNLFYIDINAYKFLVERGLVLQNGLALPQMKSTKV